MLESYLKRGNSKLGKNVLIWSISRSSCINRTDWCKKNCYGIKAETQYKDVVLNARMRNYLASKKEDFADKLIKDLSRKRNKDYVRIHEVGDFYNNDYVDKWIKIVKAFPNTKFLAFTKSYSLKDKILELNLEPNIKIYESLDESRTVQLIPELPYSDIVNKNFSAEDAEVFLDENELMCPAGVTIKKHPVCELCGYLCWLDKDKNVVFKQH